MTDASKTHLGVSGPEILPFGLGCMGMGAAALRPSDEAESIATIHAALERGVTL